jgi:hypothetical protein
MLNKFKFYIPSIYSFGPCNKGTHVLLKRGLSGGSEETQMDLSGTARVDSKVHAGETPSNVGETPSNVGETASEVTNLKAQLKELLTILDLEAQKIRMDEQATQTQLWREANQVKLVELNKERKQD